jgi:hypothetical protein
MNKVYIGKKRSICPPLTAYNTAYTAQFVRTNFGFAETSYMLGTVMRKAALTMKGDENHEFA